MRSHALLASQLELYMSVPEVAPAGGLGNRKHGYSLFDDDDEIPSGSYPGTPGAKVPGVFPGEPYSLPDPSRPPTPSGGGRPGPIRPPPNQPTPPSSP